MITLTLMALVYFLPTIIAAHRGHRVTGILLLNFLFGWTVIAWFGLLLWSLLSSPPYVFAVAPPYAQPYYPYSQWRR